MSRQAKKKELNKYRREKSYFLKRINAVTDYNEKLLGLIDIKNCNLSTLEKERVSLQREVEQLKAENYSLKHKGIFKRILGA